MWMKNSLKPGKIDETIIGDHTQGQNNFSSHQPGCENLGLGWSTEHCASAGRQN